MQVFYDLGVVCLVGKVLCYLLVDVLPDPHKAPDGFVEYVLQLLESANVLVLQIHCKF